VYLALADCFIAEPQPNTATLDLIAHLENEADDPRYEADVATAVVALRHSINACSGTCTAALPLVEKWEAKGQHFETVKRRVFLALAAADHGAAASQEQSKEALRAVAAANQAWYLRFFLRPFTVMADELVRDSRDVEVLCRLLEVDPDAWRRPIVAALAVASREIRLRLLDALAAQPNPATIEELKKVNGRDVDEVRARLIRVAAARVRINAFGSIRVGRGGSDTAVVTVRRPRQRTLLGYLLARVDNPPSRDQVIEAIWPNAEPDDAVNSLNQTVYQLRRVIDPRYRDGESPPYLVSTTDSVALDPTLVTTDLGDFRMLARGFEKREAADVRAVGNQLVNLVDGEFLAELVYEDWASSYRLAVHAEVRQILMQFTEDPWVAAYPDLGLRAATKLADLDPYDEKAHLGIARCLQAMGRREAARSAIRQFLIRLQDDLGEAPETDFSAFASPTALT
jgi:DNA-binding SARP family transcriptional activator